MNENSIVEFIKPFTLTHHRGISEVDISQIENELSVRFPFDYRTVLKWSDNVEIEIKENYLSLWPILDIPELNTSYRIPEYIPGIIGVGSNGADLCYAFDYRMKQLMPTLVKVPFNDLDSSSITNCGSSLFDYLQSLLDRE